MWLAWDAPGPRSLTGEVRPRPIPPGVSADAVLALSYGDHDPAGGENGQQAAGSIRWARSATRTDREPDIEDVISEFVDFGGNPAYGHLATRANDSMVRVIVGQLGARQDGLPAPSSGFPGASGLCLCRRAAAEPAEDRSRGEGMPVVLGPVLVEKWMQIWERAIMRSLASHVLRHPELRDQLRDGSGRGDRAVRSRGCSTTSGDPGPSTARYAT